MVKTLKPKSISTNLLAIILQVTKAEINNAANSKKIARALSSSEPLNFFNSKLIYY